MWRGELVHLLQDTPGRVSRCCFNAVGQLAFAQCFPDRAPEKLSRAARLHWESLSAYTSMAYMCFEYADYGCDGPGD